MASRKIKPTTSVAPQPRHELLQVSDTVAREKGISRDEVLFAMEQAILKAAKTKYGLDHDIRVTVDRTSGEVEITRVKKVVETVENAVLEISIEDAQKMDASCVVDDEIIEELPPVDFGRVTAQSARQVIFQKVRDAERSHIYEEFKDRVGEIVSGTVKRVEFGNVILDLGRGEGMLRKDETIPRENFRIDDRVRVIISEIRPDAKGPMILTSRVHPHFMARLFEQEVPEIYDGVIEIKGVARDAGSRAKMSVLTHDPSLDPVGSCVGVRGSRVQAIVNEFSGEKVDIVPWSDNPATYVVNALAPAEIVKVVLDEDAGRVQVVVAENQLSLAIGRRGQNVRLASQLTGWNIDIITEEEDAAKRSEEFARRTALFMNALDVDETLAQLLTTEGFSSVEEFAYTELEELLTINGLDEDIIQEIKNRAIIYLENKEKIILEKCIQGGMEESLTTLEGVASFVLEKLCDAHIKTLDDLADLSGDELLEIISEEMMTIEEANALIMKARAHWFKDGE